MAHSHHGNCARRYIHAMRGSQALDNIKHEIKKHLNKMKNNDESKFVKAISSDQGGTCNDLIRNLARNARVNVDQLFDPCPLNELWSDEVDYNYIRFDVPRTVVFFNPPFSIYAICWRKIVVDFLKGGTSFICLTTDSSSRSKFYTKFIAPIAFKVPLASFTFDRENPYPMDL